MKRVRAKFKCQSVSKVVGYSGHEFVYGAKFQAVTGNSEENQEFFAATPSGTIEVSTVAADHFEVGEEYYVDFIRAAKES